MNSIYKRISTGNTLKNKRSGPDTIIRAIEYISIASWVAFFVIVHVIAVLNPAYRGMTFYKMEEQPISRGWIISLSLILFFLIIINIAGIMLNSKRLKRDSDRLRHSLIYAIIISILGIIFLVNEPMGF